LRSVRGFYVTSDRNYSYVGVRGFARPGDYNTRILLLIDGHRLNDDIYDQALIGTELPVDIDLIERVEIVRGPASSLYGANAFFAVVNIVTKKAGDVHGLELSSEAAAFGTYSGRVTYGQQYPWADLLFSGSFYGSHGPGKLYYPEFNTPQTNFGIADHTDDDQAANLFSTISLRGLTLQLDYGTREKGIPTASYGTVFNDRRNRTIDSHAYFDLRYQRTFADTWGLLVRAYYDRSTYRGTYIYVNDRPVLDPNLDFADGQWWGGEGQVTHVFFHRHKVTAGGEWRFNLRQDQSNYDINPYLLYLKDHRDSLVRASYFQDEFTITKSLVLNAGFRYDNYDALEGSINPRAALIYRSRRHTALKLLYGTAFRVPNAYELYYGAYGVTPPTHLSPETIRSIELVWEQGLGQHLSLSTSAYANRIDNLISQQLNPDLSYTFRNLDKAKSAGLELELDGKLPSGWEGGASYAFQQTRNPAIDQVLSNSPQHLAKLKLSAPLFKKKLFASLDSQYTSRRGTLSGASVQGFALFNITLLSRNLPHHLELSGSVYNLFDKTYFDPGSAEHRQDAIQQDGRSFRLKLTWRFRE
jgi:outer membrane receptor for ferrienterochelin and colicins